MQTQEKHILLEPTDPRWMDFIQTCPDANIFHHPAWMALMHACYGYSTSIVALTDAQGDLCAGLPFMKVNSWLTGQRWVSMPFSDYCNPLYHNEAARDALAHQLEIVYQENRPGKMEIRWELPESPGIQKISEFVMNTLQLDTNPEQVSKHFKRTHLQNIRTSEKRGVTVEFGDKLEHLKIFYNLQLQTRKDHGVPAQPWKYFELLFHHIVKPGLGFVLLAQKDGEYIAGMVYLGWRKTLVAKYAASREDHLNLRPNNLLFWAGIRWGCQNGFTLFDMGRTELENTGLRNFKSRWGAVEKPLSYSIISSKPHLPMNGKLKSIMNSLISHSPLWVCRLSGQILYKHFG